MIPSPDLDPEGNFSMACVWKKCVFSKNHGWGGEQLSLPPSLGPPCYIGRRTARRRRIYAYKCVFASSSVRLTNGLGAARAVAAPSGRAQSAPRSPPLRARRRFCARCLRPSRLARPPGLPPSILLHFPIAFSQQRLLAPRSLPLPPLGLVASALYFQSQCHRRDAASPAVRAARLPPQQSMCAAPPCHTTLGRPPPPP